MLTPEGCRTRRERLADRLGVSSPVLLIDPIHVRYFANGYVDPFSLGADFGALLIIRPDGSATLVHDHRLPKSFEAVHVDERIALPWYDGQSQERGPRRLVLEEVVRQYGGRIHDVLTDPMCRDIYRHVADLRRAKDPDEVALLRTCCRAAEAGFAWARSHVRAGMTELDVYEGVFSACSTAVGRAVIVYGDFTVSPGSAKRGGGPTHHILQNQETLILDYSVVIQGYRSDFTNTLVVGGEPTSDQRKLFDFCKTAMSAGESQLKSGIPCQSVYDSLANVFAEAGVLSSFPHHAGHGLGISHPEPPYIVKRSSETLIAGDVVTLEPGLYVDGIGGIRIEHNYLISNSGYERLSNHEITLG
jgi:Xaa-Pro dipeptidase